MAFASRAFLKSVEGKVFLNNKWVTPASKAVSSLYNPYDNSLVSSAHAIGNQHDVDTAVSSARTAFHGPWSKFTGGQRGAVLNKFADLLDANAEEAAFYESICSGRVRSQLKYEVPFISSIIRYYAGWSDKIEGDVLSDDADGFYKIIRREALGVCAGITPWNGPLMVFALKAAPALATGNTFILKPPEKSPLSSLFAASLLPAAGLPEGVLNVVTGDGSTGAMLASHMKVDMVSFTGSVPTGKKIADAANNSNMKRCALELGGKSPALVFPDANIKKAIPELVRGITQNAGQVCVASSRVYVHEDIADELIAGIKAGFEAISVGEDPQDPSTTFGPVVDPVQYQKVNEFIEKGKTEATLVTGGEKYEKGGSYVTPTVFKITDANAAVYKQEIFGPVLVVRTFKTEEEAVDMANDSEFGLAAYLWTEDHRRILRVTKQLQAGHIGVNAGVALFPTAPFGGYKSSGVGKEMGKLALQDYTNVKSIYIR
ncbi:aldehyde dehydrogenase [Mytilinidion resinicola]|uniref:aldehyde dehydrogenase (NAD(+)) n=1 Tax=Mytilinidion resinicola TaxID=574789 RepID=A0A6A6YS63_9PEZI|nr:aldehyde dehydrogenase [Mytilinidion resinicola]KAF2811786.1 aldehyde dehydrogenase [Mytilinidion resinicola]